VRFGLDKTSQVTVSVYNCVGQSVRILASGEMEPGQYRLLWDGRDGDGRAVGSGVYFVMLRAGARSATTKVIRMK